MTPEQIKQMNNIEQKLNQLTDIYYRIHFIDKEVFKDPVYFNGQVYFKFPNFLKDTILPTGSDVGAQIGIVGDKIAFLGNTPIVKQTAVTTPSGGGTSSTDAIDISARTAIGQLKAIIAAFGLSN